MNSFDDKAKSWDDNPERARCTREIADAIAQEMPQNPAISAMEYGCGTGYLSFLLRERFSKITLVDTSEGMLGVVREKIARSGSAMMEARNADLEKNPGALTKPFRVIYSSLALHHIGDVAEILAAWHALLTVPGLLCVADLDTESGLFHGPDFAGHRGFDRGELKKSAEAAGFATVTFKTVCEMQKACSDGATRRFPMFLMVCRKV
ncbi:MAG: methyltransferase domain-containing protein [Chitinispirillaceae bacterium]|jgi:ubiquinone/menaquinone biosynthesis C-methylase UbiE|nr:methyltransferase domain-containing protein [Chitinispirillaceae bacterium]